jgi:cytochrome c biogenesis protein CcmG, thiol:disulfide interchange protein DsbE
MISAKQVCVFFTLFAILFSTPFIMAPPPAMAQDSKTAVAQDNAAPDFELQDLNGTSVPLHSFKGQKPVLLYFWASWCPYCMAVRPAVINLRNGVDGKDLEILAINVGGGDSLAKVKKFQEVHPAPYTTVYDGDGKAVRAYRVQGIPHFVLIDKNGSVKYRGSELPPDPMGLLK